MKISSLEIPDILLLELDIFDDDRGFFMESFNQKSFTEATGISSVFVQDNISMSHKNVLRGLHYQLPPKAQAKLISVTSGAIYDMVVDIRKGSSTFGQWLGIKLSSENRQQLWIPEGFAHGFVSLTDFSEIFYKTTDYYSQEHECCIAWNDPDISIDWLLSEEPILSEKDKRGILLHNAKLFS